MFVVLILQVFLFFELIPRYHRLWSWPLTNRLTDHPVILRSWGEAGWMPLWPDVYIYIYYGKYISYLIFAISHADFIWYWHRYVIATTLRYVRYVMSVFSGGREGYPGPWVANHIRLNCGSVHVDFVTNDWFVPTLQHSQKGHQQVFRKHLAYIYIHIYIMKHRIELIYIHTLMICAHIKIYTYI